MSTVLICEEQKWCLCPNTGARSWKFKGSKGKGYYRPYGTGRGWPSGGNYFKGGKVKSLGKGKSWSSHTFALPKAIEAPRPANSTGAQAIAAFRSFGNSRISLKVIETCRNCASSSIRHCVFHCLVGRTLQRHAIVPKASKISHLVGSSSKLGGVAFMGKSCSSSSASSHPSQGVRIGRTAIFSEAVRCSGPMNG